MRPIGEVVEADVVVVDGERHRRRSRRQTAQRGHPVLDHEPPTGQQMASGVLEAGDLLAEPGVMHVQVDDLGVLYDVDTAQAMMLARGLDA